MVCVGSVVFAFLYLSGTVFTLLVRNYDITSILLSVAVKNPCLGMAVLSGVAVLVKNWDPEIRMYGLVTSSVP